MADVSPKFKAELERGFSTAADAVIAAESWPKTQSHMIGGTYPYLIAAGRIAEGWSEEEIRNELNLRLTIGKLLDAGGAEFQPGA